MVPSPWTPLIDSNASNKTRIVGTYWRGAVMVPAPLDPRHRTKKVHFSLNLFEDFLYYKYTTKIWQNTMESEVKEKDL